MLIRTETVPTQTYEESLVGDVRCVDETAHTHTHTHKGEDTLQGIIDVTLKAKLP